MTAKTTLAAALILGLGLLGGGISAFAQEENDPLASLTAQWWQYANSIPTTVNPLVDSTGADCNVGQRDPVWFLTGTFFGGTADRTCAIPEGEWLFFPVINSVDFNTPGVCGQNGSLDVPTLRALSAAFIDGATKLTVQVDGKTVKGLVRVRSEVFATTIPTDNIYNALCGGPGTVPAGVYSPSVDDGYYVLLKPLSVGNHTVHFHAEVPSQSFVLDVTYNLVVVPVQLK
jgi:hypothetical protein